MTANDLINFWEQTISKGPFSGHFMIFAYLKKSKWLDHEYKIKCNVSHKFLTNKIQNGRQSCI